MANEAQLGALDRSNSSSSSSLLSAAGVDPLTASAAFASNTLPDGPKRPGSKHSRTSSNVSKRRSTRSNATPTDFLSDKATAQLVRRVLCPQQASDRGRATPAPIHDLLPPLTSRNDVDLQLYAIIAIILRDFVQAWYNKITPDETFVAEIVHIIAHVTRALEQRLRKIDVESLLLDELPDLLDRHIQAYRASRAPIVQFPVQADPRAIYHALCPLPQLSPIPDADNPSTVSEQAENEVAYRQLLVQGVLAVLLPTEDLENECLTSLVGEILSEMIIGGVVAKKVSEPWMIWTGLTILSDVLERKQKDARRSRMTSGRSPGGQGARRLSIPGLFWSLVHYVFAFTTLVRVLVMTLATSRNLPSRRRVWPLSTNESGRYGGGSARTKPGAQSPAELSSGAAETPVLAFSIWTTISNWLEMDRRMPWLCGNLSMVQWLAIAGPGRVAGFDGVVDRFLSDSIRQHVLDPALVPTALRNLRGALFPNNAMGTPTLFPPASDQELLALRRRCASALWGLAPKPVGRLLFGGSAAAWLARWLDRAAGDDELPLSRSGPAPNAGTNTDIGTNTWAADPGAHPDHPAAAASPAANEQNQRAHINGGGGGGPELDPQQLPRDADARIISEIEAGILDVFSDPYCNKHLMYGALELVLVRLVPELAEKGVVELWEERLS
ncbi:hypothetical protein KVR01_004696 [Diaporthe batatas]|uniref:uncharacterized protein n=1 Tax=Diaporthe batatas TaxID=748121 RepID=UPI001D05B161|nr:uncharacterized protein KVR01_004696 [Diaporthe batatas]KAG8166144.1 hypothetical protein KVR01_004696 [Diaporthe batatas]